MPSVLVAFDKFKGSLAAAEGCAIAAEAVREARPGWSVDVCPLTDGGEGFSEVLTAASGGRWCRARVTGPRGAPRDGGFGMVERLPAAVDELLAGAQGPLGLVGMATASGLAALSEPERDPWHTTSTGTGELLAQAVQAGARTLVLGIGGSATNDLGLGALDALGIRSLGPEGGPVRPPVPAMWERIVRLEGSLPVGFPRLFIACDVRNPLMGPEGCTAVYAPQKGLRCEDIPRMEQAVARLADLLCRHFGTPPTLALEPGTGAAGGIAFGLSSAASARIVPGADLVAAWLDLERRIADADLVLTGEGCFDSTSAKGKGPGFVARCAAARGKRSMVFAGSVAVEPALWPGIELHAITPPSLPLDEALREAPARLHQAVAKAAAGF